MTMPFRTARQAAALLSLACVPAWGAHLVGTVQDAASRPVAGALVVATPASAPTDAAGTPRRWIVASDAAGRFAFDDFPDGACQVTANAGPGRVGIASAPCVAAATGALDVAVVVGAQPAHVRGVVHHAPQDPATPGDVVLLARLSARDDPATAVIATRVDDGAWNADLPAGQWVAKAVTAAGDSSALLVMLPGQVKPVALSVSPTHVTHPVIARELHDMAAADQKVRNDLIASGKFGDEAAMAPMQRVDDANLARLKQIVARDGWPDAAMVGNRGMADFWLLSQHAPGSFIAQALPHLRAAADRGEIAWASLALMIDRDLMDRGKPQVYGSQWQGQGATMAMYRTVDPAHLDARRAQVGLGPIADYKALLEKDYR